MANKKLQATAELFISTKNAQKDAQIFVNNLKQKLTEIESAADKMTVFKDVVGYIGQVDNALSVLKATHKDTFDHMFDGLDANLKAQLESVFGVNGSSLGQLNALKSTINGLTTKTSIVEIRALAKSLNEVYESIGLAAPFEDIGAQFKNKTNQDHIDAITNSFANFATVWKGVNAKLSKGFGFDGNMVSGLSQEVQEEIEKLKRQEAEINEILTSINNPKNVKVTLVQKADDQVAQLKSLKEEFEAATNAKKQFETNNMTGTPEYLHSVAKYVDAAAKVKSAFESTKLTKAGNEWIMSNGLGALQNADNVLNIFLAQNESLMTKVSDMYTDKIQNIGSQVAFLERPYDTLKSKMKEYADLQDMMSHEDRFSDDELTAMDAKIQSLEKYLFALDKVGDKKKDIEKILTSVTFDGMDGLSATEGLCKLLGVDIPAEAKKAEAALKSVGNTNVVSGDVDAKSDSDNIISDAQDTVSAIEYAKKELTAAWKSYYAAVQRASDDYGLLVEDGETSTEMDKIKASIQQKIESLNPIATNPSKWGVKVDLDLSDAITDGDINIDEIEGEIDKLIKHHGISFNIPVKSKEDDIVASISDDASQIESVTSDLTHAENKIESVHDSFQQLISYISQSGSSPSKFFHGLASDVQTVDDELKGILQSLNLIDASGNANLSPITSGFTNKGGFVSDKYTMIARRITGPYGQDYLGKAENLQEKLNNAQQAGAQIGAIFDIIKDEANGLFYEVQNTVPGTAAFSHHKQNVNLDVLGASKDQLTDLVHTIKSLSDNGLFIDFGGDNILYDKDKGFSIIDLGLVGDQHHTVSSQNTIQENLNRLVNEYFKFAPSDKHADIQTMFADTLYDIAQGIDSSVINPNNRSKMSASTYDKKVVSNIQSEEAAHHENKEAIDAETAAWQALIQLKEKAQSMKWKDFAKDESLSDLKDTAGFTSVSQLEKFWKQARYEKQIDFHEIDDSEALQIFNDKLPPYLAHKWYGAQQDFTVKDKLENEILQDDEIRNAALSYLYHMYDNFTPSQFKNNNVKSFEDFLNTEFTVYRNDDNPLIYGDESKLSFSFNPDGINWFGNNTGTAKIKPKNTIGNAGSSHSKEVEVFGLNAADTSWFNETNETFEDFYNKQTKEMQDEINAGLVNLEKKRIQDLLDVDVGKLTHQVGKDKTFQDGILKQFQQGNIPNSLDILGDGSIVDDFSEVYNNLSSMDQKLVAYYASLEALSNSMPKQFSIVPYDSNASKNLVGKDASLFNAVLNDPTGLQKHVASLTGESKFGILGQNAQNVSVEANMHKMNAQAIAEEQQKQAQLNQEKQKSIQAYHDVTNKLSSDMSLEQDVPDVWNQLSDVLHQVQSVAGSLNDTDLISAGGYADNFTGEILKVKDLVTTIDNLMGNTGIDLSYVNDYLADIYKNADLDGVDKMFGTVEPPKYDDIAALLTANWLKSTKDGQPKLSSLMTNIMNLNDTPSDVISSGMVFDSITGEYTPISEIYAQINELESQYGENLQLVTAYLDNAIAEAAKQGQDSASDLKGSLDYQSVSDELKHLVESKQGGSEEFDKLAHVWHQIKNIDITSKSSSVGWLIGDGKYMSDFTGEVFDVSDLYTFIDGIEQQYGENLQYVKDYLNQVYKNVHTEGYKLDDDLLLDLDDELLLDDFDLEDEPVDKQDEAYKQALNEYVNTHNKDKEYKLNKLLSNLSHIQNSEKEAIDDGYIETGVDGEITTIDEIYALVAELQQVYSTNLDKVQAYLDEVFTTYNSNTSEFSKQSKSVKGKLLDNLSQKSAQQADGLDDFTNLYDKIDGLSQSLVINYDDGTYLSEYAEDFQSVTDILDLVKSLENQYGENLDYVKTYLQQAFNTSDLDSFYKKGPETVTDSTDVTDYTSFVDKKVKLYDDAVMSFIRQYQDASPFSEKEIQLKNLLDNLLDVESTEQMFADGGQVIDSLDGSTYGIEKVYSLVDDIQQQYSINMEKVKEYLDHVYKNYLEQEGSFDTTDVPDEDIGKDIYDVFEKPSKTHGRSSGGVGGGYALDSTVQQTNAILGNILSATQTDDKKTPTTGQQHETPTTQDAPPTDTFKQKLYNQTSAFNQYKSDLEGVEYISQSLREELDNLGVSLHEVTTQKELTDWSNNFNNVKDNIKVAQSEFEQMNLGKINLYQKELTNSFNKLTLPQKEGLFEEYSEAIILLNKQKQEVKSGHAVELAGIKEITAALQEKINKQIEANKIAKDAEKIQKKNSKFGDTAMINATAKYNTLSQLSQGEQFASSNVIKQAFQTYDQAYTKLKNMRDSLSSKEDITGSDREAFKAATTECNNYAKALEKLIKDSVKLHGERVNEDPYMLGDDFDDSVANRKEALANFAKEMYGVSLSAENFKNNFNEAVFAVKNGDGSFTQMTAQFTAARNEIVAMAGATKEATGFFGELWGQFKGKVKSIFTYLTASFSLHEAWAVVKQGVTYVKDIDTALTELKKVTDETDASYANFLQNMATTGNRIGATVKDLTTMAADWARLGYSMEEAGKLAESTAILLNVSEFQDATSASEALISTMQAFQYTADESGHVVDILNEVGNNYAVSSDGIATALQDSASALMAGGNNLEQAVAMVAAANKVVQDPNSVGSALRTISLRLRGTSVEVLEEMGEETDGVVESTSKLQEKIQALSGVNILTEAGDYKDTYTILKEIGNVWEEMSDIDQAALLELMAGKNRANTLSAILSNMEDLEGAYDSALNAEGSALKENEAYLESIQGHIDIFNNSLQSMWMSFIDTDTVKWFMHLATAAIQLADAMGLIPTAAGLFAGWKFAALELEKAFGKTSVSTKDLKNNLNNYINQQREMATVSQEVTVAKQQEAAAETQASAAAQQEGAASGQNAAANVTEAAAAEEVKNKKVEEAAASMTAANADNTEAGASANAASADQLEGQMSLFAADADNTEAQASTNAANADNVEAGASANAATADQLEGSLFGGALPTAPTVGRKQIEETASSATGFAAMLGKAGTGLKALGIAAGKAIAVMVAVKVATEALGMAWKWLDEEVINRAEHIQSTVEDLETEFKSTKDTLESNLKTLTDSSDSKVYSTLEDEFSKLAHGVDQYGNNISLTSDQYERYKAICDQIVGVNPKIAAGYDSASKAIGNNVGILQELIELQKVQQRQNIKDLIKDDNLKDFASDAYFDIQEVQDRINNTKSMLGEKDLINNAFAQDFLSTSGHWDYWDLNADGAKKSMSEVLKVLEYGESEIPRILSKYYDQEMDSYNVTEFFGDYIREIYESRVKFDEAGMGYVSEYFNNTKHLYGDSFKTYDSLLEDLDGYNEDLQAARDALIETLSQVPLGEKAYDELNNASQKFIMDWINNSDTFKIDSSMSEGQVQTLLSNSVEQIQKFTQDLSSGKISTTDHGQKITGQDLLNQIYDLDASKINYVDYQNKLSEYIETMWDMIGGKDNKYGFKNTADLSVSFGFNFAENQMELQKDRNLIAKRLNARIEDINEFLSGMTAAEVQAFYRINWNDAGYSEINTYEGIMDAINQQMQFSGEFNIADYAANITAVTDNISAYKSALESLESGTFTMSDFVSLIEQFPDLADGVDVSSKSFTGLSKNLRRAIKSSPDDLVDDLKELSQKLKDAGKNADGVDQLISYLENLPTDNIENLVSKYGELESKINDATRAQLGLTDAMSKNPNAGYETRGEALDYIKDKMSRGEIGSESEVWDVAKEYGFKYDNTKSTNVNADELAKYVAARDRWYVEGEDGGYAYEGIENFMQDVETAVAQSTELQELMQWNYDEATGAFRMNFKNSDWDTIVDYLSKTDALTQLTSEEFADLLTQIGQFHDINWSNAEDLTSYIQTIAEGSGDASTKIDLMTHSVEKYVEKTLGKDIDFEKLTSGDLDGLGDLTEEMRILLETYIQLRDKFKDPLGISAAIEGENPLDSLLKIDGIKDSLTQSGKGLTVFDSDSFTSAAKEAGYADDKIKELIETIKAYDNVITVTSNDPLGLNSTTKDIDTVSAALSALGIEYETKKGELGQPISLNINAPSLIQTLAEKGWTSAEISAYISSINSGEHGLGITLNGDISQESIDAAVAAASANTKGTVAFGPDFTQVNESTAPTLPGVVDYDADFTRAKLAVAPIKYGTIIYQDKPIKQNANGNFHISGGAFANGTVGAPKTETSLVGELGPELVVDPSTNSWHTVGDNGAEFTQVKRGQIIFNHKQTEQLLKNGYVTSRGRLQGGNSAFASGTAYADTDSYFGRYEFDGDGGWKEYDVNNKLVDSADGVASALSEAADALSNASEEFSEVFDWIEVRIEELDETLALLESQIESAVYYTDKNTIIDDLIDTNKTKLDNLEAGYEKYAAYAAELLTKVPEEYHEAVKNGAIEIEAFVGETDETTLEAIQNYREWAQKAADFKQQANEIITTIRDLAIQKFDNAYEYGDVRATVEDSQTEKLQNQVDLLEEMGEIASSVYYGINNGKADGSTGMFENSYKKIEYLTEARNAMQKELNEAVEAGQITRGSNEWYELIDQMYQVDAQIHEAIAELEEFQNAINDIYWENFDQLINRIDYLKDDTQSLIDLMANDDLVADPTKRKYENGTVEYWTADDVNWTDEGLASLGLYAQQMEISEYKARQYAEAIDDLTKEYEAGHYSENEYLEKLNELKDAQYESIEAYYDAQDAIKDLNEIRIDSIKKGIEKEIEAYEELIEAKKELLDSEKDAYDFQKNVLKQQKSISEIERQLAAIANDHSLSAAAKRKQLEAELAEAQYELQDTYYERSVEDKQTALDQELEKFQEEKDAEITKWEEYLDNVELIIADSLTIVQANATEIGATLTEKAKEYNLTVSDAVMSPWKDGALAVSDYQSTFDTAMSSTMNQLEALKNEWQKVIDKMTKASEISVSVIDKENENYAVAAKKEPVATKPAVKEEEKPKEKEITVGGMINATGAKIYKYAGDTKGDHQYFSSDPIYTVISEKDGYLAVRHHKSNYGITGWFKKSDVKAYAKGTTGVKNNQLALIDELGEELVMHASGGKLSYLTKGSAVIPHNISENLMALGTMDPQDMLDRNRPSINVHPEVHNTEVNLSMTYGDILHIDNFNGDNHEDIAKLVAKQFEKHTRDLNNAIRKYTR